MYKTLPPTLITLFQDEDYKGGGILALPSSKGIKTPTAAEISLNYVFLLPIVKMYPTKDRVDLESVQISLKCFEFFPMNFLTEISSYS